MEKQMEKQIVEVARKMFMDIITDARDAQEAIDELASEVAEELSLTRKEVAHLNKLLAGEDITFLQAMHLLGEVLDAGYYLMDDEVDVFDFIFDEKYNRKFRKVKKFIKDYRRFQ